MLLLYLLAAVPAGAATTTPLSTLLDRVGRQVQEFWNYIPGVTCTEQMTQTKLNDRGRVLFRRSSSYDYLMLLQASGDQISVDESRVEKNHKDPKGKASLLVTNGFSILELIFHPLYQSSYEFTSLPDETLDGRSLHRIAFRHIPANRSPSVLLLREREYPLEWKGVVWIDPVSYAVVRIEAGLATSMEDLGLLQLTAQVSYSDVDFSDTTRYWLPVRAVIEAATKRQHWRNTHLFTNYRRFNVETQIKTADPK